jgi:23S rRNA (adenine2503-C2)-methyltransferase
MWNNIKRIDDEAENVAKFVYTKETAVAESVLYRYPTYEERTVICCSTQSGCPVGCRFCGAGDYFVRNLSEEEIVNQVDYSIEQTGVDASEMKRLQIMFMSMGEPLLNLKALIPAMYTLYEKYPHARLLISTSGPRITESMEEALFRVSRDIPTIGLQFSVHESTDVARDKLVPFKAKMTLSEMALFGTKWWAHVNDGRKPFFNYCAHDKNNSDADAYRLRYLYSPYTFNATVSVICERNDGMPASNDHQRQLAIDFAEKLVSKYGYDTRVFDPAGQDTIGGGCGQLWFVQDWMKTNPEKARPSAGFGKEQVHVPTK